LLKVIISHEFEQHGDPILSLLIIGLLALILNLLSQSF